MPSGLVTRCMQARRLQRRRIDGATHCVNPSINARHQCTTCCSLQPAIKATCCRPTCQAASLEQSGQPTALTQSSTLTPTPQTHTKLATWLRPGCSAAQAQARGPRMPLHGRRRLAHRQLHRRRAHRPMSPRDNMQPASQGNASAGRRRSLAGWLAGWLAGPQGRHTRQCAQMGGRVVGRPAGWLAGRQLT